MTNLYDWDEIEKSNEFSSYKPDDQRAIRREWFKQNVEQTPEFSDYSDNERSQIKSRWLSMYGDNGNDIQTPSAEQEVKSVEPASPWYENMASMGGDDPTMYTDSNSDPLVRAGQLKEGFKDVARSGLKGVGAFLRSGVTLQETINKAVSLFVEKITGVKVNPLLVSPATEKIGKPLAEKAENAGNAESLSYDPEMAPKNWFESLARTVPQVITQGGLSMISPALGASTIGAQIAGGTYEELVSKGVDKDNAALLGMANAAMQAPLEQLGINSALKYFSARGKIVDLLKSAGEEFVTEWIQSYPDAFVNIFAPDPDKTLLDKTKDFLQAIPETTVQGMYEGSLTAPFSFIPGAINIARGRSEGVAEMHEADTVDGVIDGFEKATQPGPKQASFPEPSQTEADRFDLEVSLRQQEAASENAKNIQIKELQQRNAAAQQEIQNSPIYQDQVQRQQAMDSESRRQALRDEFDRMVQSRRERNQEEINATYENRRENIDASNELLQNNAARESYKIEPQINQNEKQVDINAQNDTVVGNDDAVPFLSGGIPNPTASSGKTEEAATNIKIPDKVDYVKTDSGNYRVVDDSGNDVFQGASFQSPAWARAFYERMKLSENKQTIENIKDKSDISGIKPLESNKKSVHDFASTQVNLDKDTSSKIKKISRSIPDSEIYTKPGDDSFGRVNNPHVTIRYGLDKPEINKLREVASEIKPITVKLGDTSIFKTKDYDVLKVDASGNGLEEANKIIGENFELPGETYTDYKPHATIAYLNPGEGAKYVGNKELAGKEITIDKIYVSNQDGTETEIKLGGKNSVRQSKIEDLMDDAHDFGRSGKKMDQLPNWLSKEERKSINDAYDAGNKIQDDINAGRVSEGTVKIGGQISQERDVVRQGTQKVQEAGGNQLLVSQSQERERSGIERRKTIVGPGGETGFIDRRSGQRIEGGQDRRKAGGVREGAEPESYVKNIRKNVVPKIKEMIRDETGSSQLITDIAEKGADIIRKGYNTLKRFTAKMYQHFKPHWERIKPHIENIFKIMKEYAHRLATEQKGELNIDLTGSRKSKVGSKEPPKPPGKPPASTPPGPSGPKKQGYDWSRSKRNNGEVPDNYYDEGWSDRKGAGDHAKDVLKLMKKDVAGGLDKYLGSISTRLGKIDKRLKYRLRRFEIETMKLKKQLSDDMAEIGLAAKKAMSKREFFDFDYARINGDAKKIDFFLNKYGLHDQFNKARSVFEKLKTMAKDVGVEIGTIDNYWSRYISDADGFLKATGKMSGEWGEFHKAISERAIELNLSLNEMSNEEKSKIISSMLLSGRSMNAGIKSSKHRKLEIVPPDLIKFYARADAAAQQHVNAMVDAIGMRKFFGSKPKEIKEAENKVISAKNRIVELEKELKDTSTKENDKGAIENAIKEQEQILYSNQNKISKFGMMDDFTNHINDFVLELMAKGGINETEANTVRDILLARFHQKGGPSGFWNFYKDFSTIDTMGSFISTITNLQDFCWSMYEGGFIRGSKNALLALASKSKIKAKDIGFDEINQEFASSSYLKKFVNYIFKHIGFGHVDIAGKEALINSAFEKYSNMAKKTPKKLREKIKSIFENETDSVIEDLINGNVSDNVKILLANRVLDFQPAALSEMPEAYLQMKNGRIFYFLKSYTIKQFDVYRNEIFDDISTGEYDKVKDGIKNLYRISLFFTLAGIGADTLKDFILGRKTDFSDKFTDNLLRLAGVSKWVVWKARTEGVATAAAKQILPPFKFLDALTKDIFGKKDGSGLEIVSSIPFAGKMYYWHYGKGTDKRSDLWDLRFKRQKDLLSWVENEYESSDDPQAFKREHAQEFRKLKKIKFVQFELNQYKRKINKLKKSSSDEDQIERQIERWKEKRIELIKRFMGEN